MHFLFYFLMFWVYIFYSWIGINGQIQEISEEVAILYSNSLELKKIILQTNTDVKQIHFLFVQKKFDFFSFFNTISCVCIVLMFISLSSTKDKVDLRDLSPILDTVKQFNYRFVEESRKIVELEQKITDLAVLAAKIFPDRLPETSPQYPLDLSSILPPSVLSVFGI